MLTIWDTCESVVTLKFNFWCAGSTCFPGGSNVGLRSGIMNTAQATRFRTLLQWSGCMPVITLVIIGANVLVFLAMGVTGAGWLDFDWQKAVIWGADYWPLTSTGQWWRLLTAAFVHFGLNHLISNMSVLAVAGIVTERLYGKRMYALIYLYGAVASSLAGRWLHQTGAAAGASGAVFAVIGALLVYLIVHRRGFARGMSCRLSDRFS